MSKITLSGAVPPPETNGLAQHGKDFIEHPLELVPVAGLVIASKVTNKTESGEVYPTLIFKHIEVVGDKHRKAHAKMLGDALADRTGASQLPFEAGGEVPLKSEPFGEEEMGDALQEHRDEEFE